VLRSTLVALQSTVPDPESGYMVNPMELVKGKRYLVKIKWGNIVMFYRGPGLRDDLLLVEDVFLPVLIPGQAIDILAPVDE